MLLSPIVVEEKAAKRASLKLSLADMGEDAEGTTKSTGSLRKKLLTQIKRVAHHKGGDLKTSGEYESTRNRHFSLKKATNFYQELLLLKSCQAVEQKNRLIGGKVGGFFIEVSRQVEGKVNSTHIEIEFTENDKMEYEREFIPKEHYNFVGEDESNNIVAVSVVRRESFTDFRALVRTEQKDENLEIHRTSAPLRRTLSKQEIIEALKPKVTLRRLVKTDSPKVRENLIILEKAQCIQNYKFGVVYCGENQLDENAMFSNTTGSAKWNEFLEFMGTKISLKGWQGFTGGLDTHTNSTGEHAIYALWRNFQTMFHVSTMLPFDPLDPQKLERKRHIGNDMAILVFKESSTPYSPLTITSHFIHVIIVIEPLEFEEKTFYRIEVACKDGVPPFGPHLSQPLYAKDNYFRNLLFAKLINGERAAYHAPAFRPKITRTRSQILKSCGEMVADKKTSHRNSMSLGVPASPPKSSSRKTRWATFFEKKSKRSPTASPTASPFTSPTASPVTSPTASPATSPTASPATSPTASPATSFPNLKQSQG